jgi:hypothetical protein
MVMDIIGKPEQLVKDSAESPRVVSHLAVRHDGVLLVSLEDAVGRDLTCREVVSYLVLRPEEAARVRSAAEEGAYASVSFILGDLPRGKVDA